MNDISIVVADCPDREELFAEVHYGGEAVFEVIPVPGAFEVEFGPWADGTPLRLPLEVVLEGIAKGKRRLEEMGYPD